MSAYKAKVWGALKVAMAGPFANALDFGSGDGWYARKVMDEGVVNQVTAIDVKRREHVHIEPLLYGGDRLPFESGSFDLSYSVDVLHHCPDPEAAIQELLRVTRSCIVIKDHTYESATGKFALAVLDEIGNRRFGIPSPHNYQNRWRWDDYFQQLGWRKTQLIHPLRCHRGVLGIATNRLQYISRYERSF